MVTRAQLLALGLTAEGIKHRVRRGRLHPVHRGVYAAGRPGLTRDGERIAAVLACGTGAALSHASAAALWRLRPEAGSALEVSVPADRTGRRPGIVVHRRSNLRLADLTTHDRIPVTTPVCTLVDLAVALGPAGLEAAIAAADRLDLVDPERLRGALESLPRRPGLGILREVLDRRTFALTDSELERRFLPLAHSAGLPAPRTGALVGGFRVDFFWPELGLLVETDGLRYHRTAAQQTVDRLRDQTHTAAGLTTLRFTHAQVRHRSGHVRAVLAATARRLRRRARPRSG